MILLHCTDCGDPEPPANGSVFADFGTTFGKFASYDCDKGFKIDGPKIRQCSTAGTWTEKLPACVIKGSIV